MTETSRWHRRWASCGLQTTRPSSLAAADFSRAVGLTSLALDAASGLMLGLWSFDGPVPAPFPGTPLDHRLAREGRLLSQHFWDRRTLFDVNFQPRHMTVGELEAGLRWLFGEIYNEREFTRRKRAYMEIVKRRCAAERRGRLGYRPVPCPVPQKPSPGGPEAEIADRFEFPTGGRDLPTIAQQGRQS